GEEPRAVVGVPYGPRPRWRTAAGPDYGHPLIAANDSKRAGGAMVCPKGRAAKRSAIDAAGSVNMLRRPEGGAPQSEWLTVDDLARSPAQLGSLVRSYRTGRGAARRERPVRDGPSLPARHRRPGPRRRTRAPAARAPVRRRSSGSEACRSPWRRMPREM